MNGLKKKTEVLRFTLNHVKQINKGSFVYLFLDAVCTHIVSITAIWFSAEITAMIASGESPKRIFIYALLSALIVFALSSLKEYGKTMVWTCEEKICTSEDKIYTEILAGKDYSLLENSDFQDLLKSYRTVAGNHGGVLCMPYYIFGIILNGIFGVIFSLFILAPSFEKIIHFDNTAFVSSWVFALITILLCAACSVTMTLVGNKLSKISVKHFDSMYKSMGMFIYWFDFSSNYKNGKDTRIFGAAPLIKNEYMHWLNDDYDVSWKQVQEVKGYNLALSVFQSVIVGILYIYIALRAFAGSFSADDIVIVTGVVTVMVPAIGQISNIPMFLNTWTANAEYLKRINDYDSDRYFGTLPVEKRTDNDYEIEFKNVSFKYSGSDAYALKNVSAKLKIGEHLAFVGANGSGKSTFIKLLCRLYDPTEGQILLNGIDIKKYNIKEYMSLFSVVFQDFSLFSVPLSQNVSASIEYDEEKLWKCLNEAGIAERVKEFDKKEETVLYKTLDDEGVEISGGEAQKIAIARALYREAPFIVLDEPTAALDPISEFEIYSRFNSFAKEKTAIYISHRLSSCRFCDKIMVFDKGNIVQFGTHESLLAEFEGKYSRLWTSQAKYYVSQV